MHTRSAQRIRKQMLTLGSLPLVAALSVVLLFSQAVEQGHSHDADLLSQLNCEICHQIGSLDALIVAAPPSLAPIFLADDYVVPKLRLSSARLASATARAPPTYS